MMVVIDNGGQYSDHKIYFVEMTSEALEALKSALEKQRPDDDQFSIVLAAEQVEWFSGKPMTLAAVVDDLPAFHGGECDFYEHEPTTCTPCTCWRKELNAIIKGEEETNQ